MRVLMALALLLFVPTVQAFDSGDIPPGGTWSMKFDTENPAGYSYHCHPHPWMTGMVHVMADTDGKTTTHMVSIIEPADSDAWGYDEQHLEIEVGDTVVWTNTGAAVHTVTEMSGDMDHDHDHDHDHTGDEESPVPVLLPIVALALVALLRRRA